MSTLCSLKYLEVKFEPSANLLEYEHYEDIVSGNLVSAQFDQVNRSFTRNGTIECEFVNKDGILEVGSVHAFRLENDRVGPMAKTIVDVLNNIKFVYSTNKTKELAFPKFRRFFKSVLWHGVDVEATLCLSCLVNFCQAKKVRRKIFKDNRLVKRVENLKGGNASLNEMIETFLAMNE